MKWFITLTAAIAILALTWIPITVYAGDNDPSITVPLTNVDTCPCQSLTLFHDMTCLHV